MFHGEGYSVSTEAVEALRSVLGRATIKAERWFKSRATVRTRYQWEAKGQLGDQGNGSVYAFFDAQGHAVYVGETGRSIKSRQHDQTSPHKYARWWGRWTKVWFVALPNRTDRLTLELLLVLRLSPEFNVKPGRRKIKAMFEP